MLMSSVWACSAPAPGRAGRTCRDTGAIRGARSSRSPTPRSIARVRRRASSTSPTPSPTPRERHQSRRHRRHRRLHAEPHAFRAGLGGARSRQARAVREAGRLRLPRHAAGARPGAAQGPQDEGRADVPLQPGDALHARAGRRRLHRHAVHLQRLRTEFAVARPDEPAAAGRPRRRPVDPPGVVARRIRRADHRSRAPVRRQRSQPGGRHDAQLHSRADGPRRPAA